MKIFLQTLKTPKKLISILYLINLYLYSFVNTNEKCTLTSADPVKVRLIMIVYNNFEILISIQKLIVNTIWNKPYYL